MTEVFSNSAAPFPVVGLGASAGGLAALRVFLERIPLDTGLAFVVVVHLSSEHKSHLPGILQKYTAMPVRQVAGTTELEPNSVYVIPPDRKLSTIDSHVRLEPLEPQRQQRATIDHFFRTLALTHGDKAVAVVLSGTGSDGTLGIAAIKEAGGLVMVQEPSDAEYDGMPRSALATGLADLVLPVAEMPERLYRFIQTRP